MEDKKKEVAENNKTAIKENQDKAKQSEHIEKEAEKEQKDSALPKSETVAKLDVVNEEAIKKAEDTNLDGKDKASGVQSEIGLGEIANSQFWTVDEHKRRYHPNDVKFKVHYGSGFKGSKTMEEGSIHVVSSEVAEQFTALGIGSIIK